MHESNAEAADFIVRLSLWVKVATTLCTTHVDSGESVLEDLLKAEELEDGEIDRRMETKSTLVGAEGRVELDAITALNVGLSMVIFPDDTELDDALWDL